MSAPEQLPDFLTLGTGKYASIVRRNDIELLRSTHGRGHRGNRQLVIVGTETIGKLAAAIRKVSDIKLFGVSGGDHALRVAPYLIVSFTLGKDADTDALDIIQRTPPRNDRVFSIVSRSRIERLCAFSEDSLNSRHGQ